MPRQSPSGNPHSRPPGRPRRPRSLAADFTGADPFEVLKALARDPRAGGQMEALSRAALAQAVAAIDDFNVMVGLPAIYPHLVEEMQLEIDRQRALLALRTSPRR